MGALSTIFVFIFHLNQEKVASITLLSKSQWNKCMLGQLKHLAFSIEFNCQTLCCKVARKCWFMKKVKEKWSLWSSFILQSHDISGILNTNSCFKKEFAAHHLEFSHTWDIFADNGGLSCLILPAPYFIRSELFFFDAYKLYYQSWTSSP